MNPKQSEYNKRHEQKRIDQGFVRKRALIPKSRTNEFLALIREWRQAELSSYTQNGNDHS